MCVRVDKCVTCAAAVRQREVSSRDARSVANLARFSAFVIVLFFFKKATSDKSSDFLDKLLASLSECLCDRRNDARSAHTQLFLCICSVQRASERSSSFS